MKVLWFIYITTVAHASMDSGYFPTRATFPQLKLTAEDVDLLTAPASQAFVERIFLSVDC